MSNFYRVLAAMMKAMALCVPGADIYAICQETDAFIEAECKNVFNGKKAKKLERGVAFPTCVSVNHIVGHFSPLADESQQLKEGDVAKIICGAHIDGFASNTAHTVIVGGTKDGRKLDVLHAAHDALRAAERAIQDGSTNQEVTAIMNKVMAEYECNMPEGVLSHVVKKYCIDGNKVIIGKEVPLQQVEDWTFQPGEVIHMDVYATTGEGKPKLAEFRTTVYKRELQNQYSLKIQKSRQFFAEANKKFPSLPFSLRAFEDQIGAKVGVKECVDHELMQEFQVLTEKEGEFVAHFKSTIAILPRSTVVLAGALPNKAATESTHSIKDESVKSAIKKDLFAKVKEAKK